MGVGRGLGALESHGLGCLGPSEGGLGPWNPMDFENFGKKNCFFSFEWEKRNFANFAPPLEKF